jgi:hypothetical protein
MQLKRPIQTRFRYGYAPEGLNLAAYKQLAGSLCKRHAVTLYEYKAPTDRKHMVSGTISLPARGTFHLSLTVLVHYRSDESI